jgi:2-polyprenyl-6-methoxyphenol hydroxylase-like FAD-dependent oxidoreductase
MDMARKEAVPPGITMRKYDGTTIGTFPVGDPGNPSLPIYRSKLHRVLGEYAAQLGIEVEFETSGFGYFEGESDAGVILADGRRLTADLVVAADGVGSRSWELVVGTKQPPVSSGFVLYRVTFPVGPALENPVVARELEGYKNRAFLHAGPGAHMVTCKNGDEVCYLLTCRVLRSIIYP